jgi:transcriptional regulator with XRE-family HTH domain
MYISQNIRFLRKSKNLRQTDLGELLNVTGSQITAYEKGASYPKFEGLVKLCEIFQVNLHDLVYTDLEHQAPKGEEDLLAVIQKLETEVEALRDVVRLKAPEIAKHLGIHDP